MNQIEVQASCVVTDPGGVDIIRIGGITGPDFTLIGEIVGNRATTTLTDAKFEHLGFGGRAPLLLFDFGHTFDNDPVAPDAASISSLDGTYDNPGVIISFADILLDPFVNGAAIGVIDPPAAVLAAPPVPFAGAIGPVISGVPVDSHGMTIAFVLDFEDQINLPTSAGIITVPEPGSLILLTFGALMLARRRRQTHSVTETTHGSLRCRGGVGGAKSH